MKRTTPIAAILGWLTLVFAPSHTVHAAENAPSGSIQASGSVEGRVFNAETSTALANARVTVNGSARETTTDEGGRFLLTGVPSGQAKLIVDYVGLEPQTIAIDVPAGGLVQREINLSRAGSVKAADKSEIVKLDKFKVVEDSQMSAQAIAVNEQRNSANIKNVVAMSEFGDRGGENIGEFLLFLPGITIINTGTEADSVSVRGVPANNTPLLLDGAQMATGESGTRTVSLRAVPMANISRVEVTKVPTPDTPASGLGGTINLISGSGFDKKVAELNYNTYFQFHNTTGLTFDGGRRWQLPATTAPYNEPSFDVRYTKPVTRNFAFTVSAVRTWRINPNQVDETATWDLIRNVQASSQWARITQVFETRSGQLGADWRLSPQDTLTFSFSHRLYARPTTRSNMTLTFGANATGDATFTQGASTGVGSISQGSNWRIDTIETDQGSIKYRHQGNGWKLDANAAWSESVGKQEDVSKGFFNNATASFTNLVVRGDNIPSSDGIIPRKFSATERTGAPVDIYNGDNYSLVSGTSGEYKRVGQVNHGGLDLTRELDVKVPLTLKIGAAVNQERRDARAFNRTWNFAPNGATDVASRQAKKFDLFDEAFLKDPPLVYGVPFRTISHKKAYELYQQHPDWFVLDQPLAYQNLVTNSREYTETISAGYLRADARLLDRRLWIATGVRYERTAGDGLGPLDDINAQYQRDANGKFVLNSAGQKILITSDTLAQAKLRYKERGAEASSAYGGFYPSLNATYELTSKLLIRAAYAKTIGRPDISFIQPGVTVSAADIANPTITVNNPNLKPWTADNWDLSLESYNFKGGFGSIGVFRKDIKNFFGTVTSPATPELLQSFGLGSDPTYANYSISTRSNAGDATVNGVEFGYRQSLTFLPHFARGFQVFFNATRLQVEGSNTADFSGFSPATYSGGINFIRERFYIKFNYSYLGEIRTTLVATSATIPAGTYVFQSPISRYGASAQYNLTRNVGLYLSMTDINSVTKLGTRKAPQTPTWAQGFRYQQLGYYTTIGIKGSF